MKCKKTIDAREYEHRTLEEMRISAVRRVESGESAEEVATGYGINRRTPYRWLASYHYGGMDALRAKAIPGAPSQLSAQQMQRLAKLIRDQDPQQLRFDFALWTLAIIRAVSKQKFNVRLSEVSVGRLMKRLGVLPNDRYTGPGNKTPG